MLVGRFRLHHIRYGTLLDVTRDYSAVTIQECPGRFRDGKINILFKFFGYFVATDWLLFPISAPTISHSQFNIHS